MGTRSVHLAQFNIGRMRAPIDDPVMEGFRSQLERINAIADASPGFVWRLQTAEGDATTVRAYPDPFTIVNMSVWESLEALHEYVYRSPHVGPLRDRRQWFEPADGPTLVSGGCPPATSRPSRRRWRSSSTSASTVPAPSAFTFRQPFPPPGEAAVKAPEEAQSSALPTADRGARVIGRRLLRGRWPGRPPRSTYFWILPVAVFGSSATNVKPLRRLEVRQAARARTARSSSSVAAAPARAPRTRAAPRPTSRRGRPTTATSCTAGCRSSTPSTSTDEMFSPPLMMTSLSRSRIST